MKKKKRNSIKVSNCMGEIGFKFLHLWDPELHSKCTHTYSMKLTGLNKRLKMIFNKLQ